MNSREVYYLSKLKYTLGFYGIKFINHTPKEKKFIRSLYFKIQINKIERKRTKIPF